MPFKGKPTTYNGITYPTIKAARSAVYATAIRYEILVSEEGHPYFIKDTTKGPYMMLISTPEVEHRFFSPSKLVDKYKIGIGFLSGFSMCSWFSYDPKTHKTERVSFSYKDNKLDYDAYRRAKSYKFNYVDEIPF